MTPYQICSIFMVLFLVQNVLAKPVSDSSEFLDSSDEKIRENPTAAQKLLLFTFDNFISLGKHFSANAANVSRSMLKDEALLANDKPEVLEFKKNLTLFVEKQETNKKSLLLWDIIEIYTDTIDKYSDVPEEKVTPDSKFIMEILKKYNSDEVIEQFAKEFVKFMGDFEKLFEENKNDLDKPMLDWYEKYSKLTDIEEKIDAYTGFIEFA